jgi:predicted DNA binding protein
MSTIAELELPAEEFALARTFRDVPSVEFEVERVAAYEQERLLPFIWATGEDIAHGTLEEALETDPSVENVRLLADLEDEWLYQMDWVSEIRIVLHAMLEEEATVLTAVGRDDRWLLRVHFPDRESLSRTYDFCTDNEFSLSVNSIYQLDERRHGQYGLTKEQHESLVTASKMGYYDVPRNITMTEVAEELGISHQALSERLRRGHGRLVRNALVVGAASPEKKR